MKRNVIQDFTNVCAQMLLTSLRNDDRINFVILGSGTIKMNFMSQRCSHNNHAISPLFYCISFQEWLEDSCTKQNIDMSIFDVAELYVEYEIRTYRKSGNLGWLCASTDLDCASKFVASKKEYTSKISESQEWGLGQIISGNHY